jgi:hypothetical protein
MTERSPILQRSVKARRFCTLGFVGGFVGFSVGANVVMLQGGPCASQLLFSTAAMQHAAPPGRWPHPSPAQTPQLAGQHAHVLLTAVTPVAQVGSGTGEAVGPGVFGGFGVGLVALCAARQSVVPAAQRLPALNVAASVSL